MKKLTRILALAITLALLACGFVIAISADEAAGTTPTYLVSESGQTLSDYTEASINYSDIAREVTYFYAPSTLESVSEGYIKAATSDKEGYDKWVRAAYAIYDNATGELVSVHESVFVSLEDNFSKNLTVASGEASKGGLGKDAIVVLYQDLDLKDCPVQNSGSHGVIQCYYDMLIDLNGYKLKRRRTPTP